MGGPVSRLPRPASRTQKLTPGPEGSPPRPHDRTGTGQALLRPSQVPANPDQAPHRPRPCHPTPTAASGWRGLTDHQTVTTPPPRRTPHETPHPRTPATHRDAPTSTRPRRRLGEARTRHPGGTLTPWKTSQNTSSAAPSPTPTPPPGTPEQPQDDGLPRHHTSKALPVSCTASSWTPRTPESPPTQQPHCSPARTSPASAPYSPPAQPHPTKQQPTSSPPNSTATHAGQPKKTTPS